MKHRRDHGERQIENWGPSAPQVASQKNAIVKPSLGASGTVPFINRIMSLVACCSTFRSSVHCEDAKAGLLREMPGRNEWEWGKPGKTLQLELEAFSALIMSGDIGHVS